jgi:Ca2+-binding RTX toxin-like protein
MFGGKNNDNMSAGGGDDLVSGQVGNDTVAGGVGNDDQRGGDGDDFIDAKDGETDKKVSGGSGTDTCLFDPGLDQIIRECEIQNP